jgi:tetratricopeptide (TPR) repeat protein
MALGILLSEHRSPAEGLSNLQTAVTGADQLMAVEPRNAVWKLTGAMTRLKFAQLLLTAGNSDQARSQWANGCRLAAGLKTNGAGLSEARSTQTDCFIIESRLDLAGGATETALAAAQRALASARLERNQDPVNGRYRIAAVYLLLGDIRQQIGDPGAAKSAWTAGLAQLPQRVAERPQDMNTHAELLRRLGRNAEARPLTARLEAIGYRSAT